MAYTWGSMNLKIVPMTYQPYWYTNGIIVVDILPNGTANPANVIQQAGRGRKIVNFDGFVTSYADYSSLRADYLSLTSRTFSDGTDSMSMVISELSPALMIIPGKWDYSITLMEA